jgi:hypothetical protein
MYFGRLGFSVGQAPPYVVFDDKEGGGNEFLLAVWLFDHILCGGFILRNWICGN